MTDRSPIAVIEALRKRHHGKRVVSVDQLSGRGHILLDGRLSMQILNDPDLLRPAILLLLSLLRQRLKSIDRIVLLLPTTG